MILYYAPYLVPNPGIVNTTTALSNGLIILTTKPIVAPVMVVPAEILEADAGRQEGYLSKLAQTTWC